MLLRILLALAVPCISGQILTPPNDGLYLGSTCNTPHGNRGTCTVLQKCSAVFEKVKTKKISLRSLQICGFEKKDPIVCCEDSQSGDGWGNTTPTALTSSTTETIIPTNTNPPTIGGPILLQTNLTMKMVEDAQKVPMPSGQGTTESIRSDLTSPTTPSASTEPSVPASSTESESDAWIVVALLNTPHLSTEEIYSVKGLDEALKSAGIQTNLTRSGDTRRPAEIACDQYTKNALKALQFNIISGIPAKAGEFPHMAAMAFSSIGGSEYEFKCGASLISENYALTAAHCVNRPDLRPLFLRLGKITLTLDIDDLDAIDVGVDRVILHPEYKVSLVYHDIALLKLNQSVQFNPFVRPVCLYASSGPIAKGTVLTVTGWGKTSFTGGSFNDVLLKANVTEVDTSECNETYTNNGVLERRMRFGIRSEGQLCAFGKEDQDACQGDSGGPLQIVLEEGSSIQVGIVSFGSGCGLLPGVYTKVSDYIDWIESIVWPR